jgi:vacuolar-type H+-ATPase subunit H
MIEKATEEAAHGAQKEIAQLREEARVRIERIRSTAGQHMDTAVQSIIEGI